MDVGLVCDACSALTPIGVPQCARCGEPVALDPRPKKPSKPAPAAPAKPAPNNGRSAPAPAPAAAATGKPCGKCGTMIAPNIKFCPSCGARAVIQDQFDVETQVVP